MEKILKNSALQCFKQSNCKYRIWITVQNQAYNSRSLVLLSECHTIFYLPGPLFDAFYSAKSSNTGRISSLSNCMAQLTLCKMRILHGLPYLTFLCVSYLHLLLFICLASTLTGLHFLIGIYVLQQEKSLDFPRNKSISLFH